MEGQIRVTSPGKVKCKGMQGGMKVCRGVWRCTEGCVRWCKSHCRQENGSLHDLPMETSFSHWNTSLLLQDKNPIIGRIFAGNPNIQFLICLPNRDVISSLNPPNSHDPNGGTYIRIGGLLKEK